MNYLKTSFIVVQLALSLIPDIIALVKAIETTGNGPLKLKAVIDFIKAAFDLTPDDVQKAIGMDRVEAFATKVIGIIVAYLNAIGLFKTGPQV